VEFGCAMRPEKSDNVDYEEGELDDSDENNESSSEATPPDGNCTRVRLCVF
jgi:hypothetical protein